MIRGPPDQPSHNMITACCDHKRCIGRPQTRKKVMVENLHLLLQDVTTINIDRFGSLRNWIHKASNEEYWIQLVAHLLNPCTPIPEHPEAWGPLPSWCTQCDTSNRHPADYESDDNDDEDGNDDSHNNRNDSDNESRERQQPPPSP